MTERFAAVLLRGGPSAAAPPGTDARAVRTAMAEDVLEMLTGLRLLRPVLGLCPPDQPDAAALAWPGTPVVGVSATEPVPSQALLRALGARGASVAAVVADDAPDLPGLLVGKLFRALGSAPVAACPARDGGLVAVAARLPLAGWVTDAAVDLDTDDALDRLAAAAPHRRDLGIAPGWHRIRRPEDLDVLDAGLEGWESTRTLLGR